MDRGAWRATVRGAAESDPRLKGLGVRTHTQLHRGTFPAFHNTVYSSRTR